MKKVTILALDDAMSSSVMGTMDIFSQAGFTWNYIMGFDTDPFFDVEIVTQEGKSVKGFNNVKIHPHRAAEEVESTDLIIISSVSDFEPLASNRKAVNWLKHHHGQGTTIGSLCIGSFLLAETGLLDGKTATTHWGFANEFQRRYPEIHLRPRQLITDEGTVLCSGSCNSYVDLSVYLIERYCGSKVAVECSKTMIHDYARSSQAPYIVFQQKKDHGDPRVLAAQKMIEENYFRSFDFDKIARDHGMSRRTFERRFKKATEVSPLAYLQCVRVEAAKQLLETGLQTFDEISYRVGYADSNFFRKVFVKQTGLRPKEYKIKFQR
ncbi:MAG: helix-turn-helix domain-containing protein [bacterium]|nr:helix-turn-helix domain-containing protein [bacterium]